MDSQVREKAVESMTAALEKVAQEDNSSAELPLASTVAAKVEDELFKLYGRHP